MSHDTPIPPRKKRATDAELNFKWEPIADRMRMMFQSQESTALARELGVSSEALYDLHVGYGMLDGSYCWTFPERNEKGWIIGIRRRLHEPDDRGRTKLCATGSRPGLTYCRARLDGEGPIYLVEGASDTAALCTIGVAAIGRPSNTGGLDLLAKLLRNFPGRKIVVIGEWDKKLRVKEIKDRPHDKKCRGCNRCWPGKYGAIATASHLSERLRRPVSSLMPPRQRKDSRAFVQSLGLDLADRDACYAAGERLRHGSF